MIEFGISVLMTLCFVPGLLLRYVPFKSLVTPKQKRILFTAYVAVGALNILVMCLALNVLGLSSAYLKNGLMAFGLVTALINILVIRGKLWEHLFVYGIVVICSYLIASLPTLFTGLLVGLDSVQSYVVGVLSYGLFQLAFYIPVRRLLRYTVEPFLTLDSGDFWRTIWFIPVAMHLAMYLAFPDSVHTETVNHIFSRALIGAATILMCMTIAADHQRLEERKIMVEQLAAQKLHYAQLQQKVEDARASHHDFKHHIAAIQRFMDTDDKEDLQEYCNELLARSSTEAQIPYTGNAAADGVLYRYMQLCYERQIPFSCVGKIKSTGIADMDICVLLGNALDNAFNGCLTVTDHPSISVIAQTEAQMLSILVRNTFDGQVKTKDDVLLSRKRENAPGIGMQSMKSVCERYGGMLQTQWTQDTFTVLFVLPIEQEE